MPVARKEIVDPNIPGLYHCVSRCVRRAFLCGDGYDHRRQWIRERLEELVGIFAVDIVAFAILSNHLHVILWTDPERVDRWSDAEVAERWLRLYPKSCPDDLPIEEAARQIAMDSARIEELRKRLSSLSWFMRCLKEPIARLANAEDGCSGHFWEGRFKSYRIADDAGGLTCCVYVDLNLIRAGLAATPEDSRHTSVWERIQIRQAYARQKSDRKRDRDSTTSRSKRESRTRTLTTQARSKRPRRRLRHEEDGLWLAPMASHGSTRAESSRATTRARRTIFGIGIDLYLDLVDCIGRLMRAGKRGAIPGHLRPILERLEINVESWVETLTRETTQLWGSTIGLASSLMKEAERRKRRWVVNPFDPLG